jgi:TolA-binding protein
MTNLGNNRRLSIRFSSRPLAMILGLLLLSMTATGCTAWRNFSTYFNTLYLAQQHLDRYEDQISNPPPAPTSAVAVTQRRWLDEEYESRIIAARNGQPMKITPSFVRNITGTAPRITGNTSHLDSAIILGSIVLSKKGVKYIEDALFIIGKAQYYKNDYSGAKRKFLELLSQYPKTEYAAEAHTFLARAMIATGKLDTADAALGSALALAESSGDKHAIAAAQRAQAEYLYGRNSDSLDAMRAALLRAEENLDGHEAAQMAFESGAIAYLEGKWDAAEAAFNRAADKSEQDYFTGEARIAHAMALRRLNRFAESKRELSEVSEKNVFILSKPAAKYEYALTVEMESRYAAGADVNTPQFKAEQLPKIRDAYVVVDTSFKSESQAVISRSKFRQAELYRTLGQYDSASKYASTLIATKDFSTPTYNEYVSEKMRSLSRFSFWQTDILSADSTLERVRKARAGENENKMDVLIRRDAVTEVLGDRARPDFAVQLTKEDSMRVEIKMQEMRAARGLPTTKLVIRDTSKFLDSLNLRRANAYYELGRAYENFDAISTSRDYYLRALDHHFVVQDTAKEAFRAQVYYAWLQLEHREKRFAIRDSILNILTTRYGQTIYSEQAHNLFGAQADPNSPAEVAYREAYRELKSRGVEAAKPSLVRVRVSYKNEDVAPRALYAIGLSYEDQLRFDSAVVYYTDILTNYPYSVYAEALRPRLADVAAARPRRSAARRVEAPAKSPEEMDMEELKRAREAREKELYQEELEIPRPFGGDKNQPEEQSAPTMPVPPPPSSVTDSK